MTLMSDHHLYVLIMCFMHAVLYICDHTSHLPLTART